MRALICGAGIAGLATAWCLEHVGWEVTVVEHAPQLRDEGYMIDFWDAGYDAAERMGLLPRQAVSLLAGQGASMAVAGAHALATELAAWADVPAALDAYERRMRPAIVKKQAAGRRTANWFVPDSWARIRVRDAVLHLSTLRPLEWLLRPVLTTPDSTG